MDLAHARGAERPLGRAPEVEPAVVHDSRAEPLAERIRHLLPDLVAARPDARADRGGEPAAECRGAALDDPGEQAPPADVECGDRRPCAVRPCERDRQAVGGEDEQRLAGRIRPEAVAGPAASGRTPDRRAVNLASVREQLGLGADLRASRRRFSATRSGSSPVSRPRLSVSNGASLTPPRRVENATAYGPGASQRRAEASLVGDQLPRGGELGLAAVELAAQLAAAELLEDLPHPRRLGEAELREVVAVDLETDVAQPREPVAQRR